MTWGISGTRRVLGHEFFIFFYVLLYSTQKALKSLEPFFPCHFLSIIVLQHHHAKFQKDLMTFLMNWGPNSVQFGMYINFVYLFFRLYRVRWKKKKNTIRRREYSQKFAPKLNLWVPILRNFAIFAKRCRVFCWIWVHEFVLRKPNTVSNEKVVNSK